ncbi:hypothetical protein CHS0354_010858 [Potamilus streckersoni]|uniref:Pacifastin domain-containing protein n=1 Tax=Potamilus streckersoni TaxID=2493646 RepID=A0AAE0SNG4_9BIVA|nr:hypothetical protein CHS0354_010858 [Potamilus streckersoni]
MAKYICFIVLITCSLALDTPCEFGSPLPSVFCGRGPNRQDCPSGYFCHIDPLDRFAVCCAQVLTCLYNGITYHTGDSFKSSDGCNTCGCNNGMVFCTERACFDVHG